MLVGVAVARVLLLQGHRIAAAFVGLARDEVALLEGRRSVLQNVLHAETVAAHWALRAHAAPVGAQALLVGPVVLALLVNLHGCALPPIALLLSRRW